MRIVIAAITFAALAGCASSPDSAGGYNAELTRLSADCEARGGILVPNGRQSAHPQADNECKITGVASRLRD